MSVTFSLDATEFTNEIQDVINKLSNKGDLLNEMGQILVDDAKKRIESTKRDPDGSPWAPWSIATEMGRMHDGTYSTGLLWRTGDLLSSIDYSVSGDNVFVGSPLNYAGFVQDGTGNMPAREFLGMSDEAHTQIMKATEQFLQDAI